MHSRDTRSYNVGDAIGSDGTRVLLKFTGSATVSNFEHTLAAGKTNFYQFFALNNDMYSPGALRGATTAVYRTFEIVEPFSYSNGLTMTSARSLGNGWSGAWNQNFGTFTVVTDQFAAISGGAAAAGNSITGNNASIYRDFSEASDFAEIAEEVGEPVEPGKLL